MSRKVTETTKTNTKEETETRYVTASMRIERYYSSVREDTSTLSDDALTLLGRQDYIGFFMACGPTYIRGIRRAQEVFTIFSYQSSSVEKAETFSKQIRTSSWKNMSFTYRKKCKWYQPWCKRRRYTVNYRTDFNYEVTNENTSTKSSNEEKSLQIDIQGFGLGLSQDGSETMVATSLDDHHRVMLFAFNTMTRTPDYAHIGMVYGVEVVNWVENINFQVAANLQDEVVEVPLPLSLIPRSYRILTSGEKDYDYYSATPTVQAEFFCKDPASVKDKYGLCCETGSLYNAATGEYQDDDPTQRVCRPIRVLDPAFLKDNMSTNAEFVSRLEQLVRSKIYELTTTERCISAVRAIPERYDAYLLKPNARVHDGTIATDPSVFEMKMALDPYNDFSLVTHVAKEFDEFMEMFIQPCHAALFGANIGRTPDEDVSYFMAYPWYTHDSCSKLSCMAPGMRWNRDNAKGGCVASMSSGSSAALYTSDGSCSKELEPTNPNANSLNCKHTTTKMNDNVRYFKKAWDNIANFGRIDIFMETYCMPNLQEENTLSIIQLETLKTKTKALTNWYNNQLKSSTPIPTTIEMNVALGKSTVQSGTYFEWWKPYLTHHSRHAVDGITQGMNHRGQVSITYYTSNPYWEVNLGSDYTITKVIVYNRQDCCANRLNGAQITLYDNNGNSLKSDTATLQTAVYKNEWTLDSKRTLVRKVRVQIPRTEWLQLAEVEVYAEVSADSLLI